MKMRTLFLILFFLIQLNSYCQENLTSNNNLPVGTVITSMVNFDVFCQISGDLSSINWSANTSKWAPADGRNIEGSKYKQYTGSKNLPDLRGVFLRGLNEFDTKSQTTVSSNQADPENNRKAGSFQNQSTQIKTISKTNLDCFFGGVLRKDGLYLNGNDPVDNSETRPNNVAVYYYIKIN